jgi:hypothetical protein
MIVFDNNSRPLILDSIFVPTATDHVWVLDLAMMDFCMTPLLLLEEITCETIEVTIEGFAFCLPAMWNILIHDTETAQLDIMRINELCGREFTAFVYGPKMLMPRGAIVQTTDYYIEHANIGPSLNKHLMLCHGIGPDAWVVVGPNNLYNKYLKDKTIGDIT